MKKVPVVINSVRQQRLKKHLSVPKWDCSFIS